jgi:PAS domain S-box-containing protein
MAISLDDVLITDDLACRPSRPPNFEAENRALADLVAAMADSPQVILQKLVETALVLCRADSAGISVLETGGTAGVLRWAAIAGQLASNSGGQVPRGCPCPCGMALDRDTSLLFAYPERYFDFGPSAGPQIAEVLVVPFHAEGKPVGALWVMVHTPSRKFDSEDQRLLTSLSRFAAAAYHLKTAAIAAINARDEVAQILDTTPTGLTRCSRDLRFLSVNPAIAKLLGLPAESIIGRPMVEVLGEKAFEVIRPYIERVLRGERVEYEEEVPYAGGTRFMHIVYTPWFDHEGQVGGWVASGSDITDLHRATTALREREQRLRLALDASGGGSFNWDVSANRLDWDDRFRAIYGFAPEEPPTAASWGARLHEEDREHVLALFHEIMHSTARDSWNSTFRIVKPDGTVSWIESVGRAERNAEGEVTRLTGLELDVTERRRTEEALRATEARLRVFLEHSPTVSWLKDEEGRHVFVSPSYESRFGVRRDEWYGKTDFDLWPKAAAEQFWRNDQAVLAADGPLEVLESVPNRDGTISWWLSNKFWFRDASGKRYVGGIGLDVTGRKKAEEALRQSEERFRLAAEVTGFGTFDYDPVRKHTSISPEFWSILGWPDTGPPADVDVMQFVHPDDLPEFRTMWTASLEPSGAGHHVVEGRIVRPDGELRWVHVVSHTFFEGQGESRRAARIVGTVLDVTQVVRLRQHLEVALRRTDSELRTIVKAAPIGIVTSDHTGRITTWNDAAERIFGYTAEDVVGRLNPAIPDEAIPEALLCISSVLEGATVQTGGRRIRKDGAVIYVSLVHSPLYDEHGAVRGVITLVQDITEKKNAETALARVRSALAEVQAEEARRLARDLHDDISQRLALLSFDIDRMATLPQLSRDELAAGFRSCQGKIVDICDGLRQISHRMHPSVLEHLGLPNALKHLCRDFSQREEIPVRFSSDELMYDVPGNISSCLYRVAQEALRNISKHAKASDAEVKLAITGQTIQLSIADSGDGFDTSDEKSGLGLHSMRERVELVGGGFSIMSGPGSGTRIVVSVPLQELPSERSWRDGDVAPQPNEQHIEPQTKKCRVLIGDDHPLFAAGVAKLLEDLCEVVGTAGDGLALVKAAERLSPDLILLDISMPVMNGFDAARQIRKSVPGTKLLFLTTHSNAAYADEAFKSGANGYLVKQAASSELRTAIAAVLDGQQYRTAAIASRSRGNP